VEEFLTKCSDHAKLLRTLYPRLDSVVGEPFFSNLLIKSEVQTIFKSNTKVPQYKCKIYRFSYRDLLTNKEKKHLQSVQALIQMNDAEKLNLLKKLEVIRYPNTKDYPEVLHGEYTVCVKKVQVWKEGEAVEYMGTLEKYNKIEDHHSWVLSARDSKAISLQLTASQQGTI